jgi:hypothetical protein
MKQANAGIANMIFEHMPGLRPEDMGFLSHAFSKSSLVDSNFFYFTSLPVGDRVERAALRLNETPIGNSLYRSQTVRQYGDITAQLCASIFKDSPSPEWLVELAQAPLLSEALTSGSCNFPQAERDALRQYADQVLTQGAEEGAPAALHHQNCLRILAGDLPKQMANRMVLMLSYHRNTLEEDRANQLSELYDAAPDLNFAQLRNQALQIEALHQTLDQCRDIRAGNATKLAASFSSLHERTFDHPDVQRFYIAFRESYFARRADFRQALSDAADAIAVKTMQAATPQDGLAKRAP